MLGIVFHQSRPEHNVSDLVHLNVLIHHFLMSMDRYAQAIVSRLLPQAGRDGAMIMDIDI